MPVVFYFIGLLLLFFSPASGEEQSSTSSEYKTYIVHVKRTPDHISSHREWHESFLSTGDEGSESRLMYSYGHVFSGFAARLTEVQLEAMRIKEGFVHAHPDQVLTLATTHTPSFLGLNRVDTGFWTQSGFGNGTIIGVIDTGIHPNHPSFDDDGIPPPPTRWKGRCDFQPSSLCNNKIIGARSFIIGDSREISPFDFNGHGTHVAGTAAGRFVANASVLGSANGTAAGMAPYAHLAIYKACNAQVKCSSSAILAAIEAAVGDGVDVISMSLGGRPISFFSNPTAIASFHATRLGVLFSSSAGNSGPRFGTIGNDSPWMLTVGASTMDRRIRAVVKLGNGLELEGESAYQPNDFPSTLLPLVLPASSNDPSAASCSNLTMLLEVDIAGKIVLCTNFGTNNTYRSNIVKEAGATAMILMNIPDRGFDTTARANLIPTSHVSFEDGLNIRSYTNTTSNSTATIIFKGTHIGGYTDPAVAAFSSRGPSPVARGVLKPDIIGPGVNVLAAWHEAVGPFEVLPHFNMISGTSMSCPHLSGIAALLKASHPDWSPAMIKSALMTTTDVTNLNRTAILDNLDRNTASFFAMGSGHVNPTRASNPGLVYDIQPEDYIGYLCAIGYTDAQVSIVAQDTTSCSTIKFTDLNYPSFSLVFNTSTNSSTRQAYRTLTNVGAPNSTYTVVVSPPLAVTVTVQPETISFSTIGEKKSFTVNFVLQDGQVVPPGFTVITEGFLTWVSSDNLVQVNSPISVIIGAPFESQTMKTSKVTLHRSEHDH